MFKDQLVRKYELSKIRKSDLFDEAYYRKKANIPESTDAIIHYYDGGWRQADPSMRFNQANYLEANQDVRDAGLCPLAHYLRYGIREKRRLVPNGTTSRYHRYAAWRGIKRTVCEVRDRKLLTRNKDAKILVVLHMFYEESSYEIIEYLKNLRKYKYDLVVTTVEGRDIDYIRKVFLDYKPDAEIRVYPNIGFDVAPYLDVIQDKKASEYDVVIKMQSKRLFDRNGVVAASMYIRGRDWFLYLFESVLGAQHVHKNIDRLKNDPSIELIAAENLLMQDPPHKVRLSRKKLSELGLALPEEYTFVAGTCFAMKGTAVGEKHTNLGAEDQFEDSERKFFSMAHAIERYITGIVPASAQRGNRVCALRRMYAWIKGRKILELCGIKVTRDENYHFDDDFVLRCLEYVPVFHYEMIEMKVQDLYIILDEEKIPLRECMPYLYMKGDKENYIQYCLKNRKTDYMSLSQKQFEKEVLENGERRFEKLIADLDQTGYDTTHPVVICRDGQILDGQHRACWYMYRYGEDSLIKVLHLQTDFEE